jgi:hypothetical protein
MSAWRDKSQGVVFIFTDKDFTQREYSFNNVEEYTDSTPENTEMEFYKLIENAMHMLEHDSHDIRLIIDELIKQLTKLK